MAERIVIAAAIHNILLQQEFNTSDRDTYIIYIKPLHIAQTIDIIIPSIMTVTLRRRSTDAPNNNNTNEEPEYYNVIKVQTIKTKPKQPQLSLTSINTLSDLKSIKSQDPVLFHSRCTFRQGTF